MEVGRSYEIHQEVPRPPPPDHEGEWRRWVASPWAGRRSAPQGELIVMCTDGVDHSIIPRRIGFESPG